MALRLPTSTCLGNRCQDRSLPLTSLGLQQHRRIYTAVLNRNEHFISLKRHSAVSGAASVHENDVPNVERRRQELSNKDSLWSDGGMNCEEEWLNRLEETNKFYCEEGRLPRAGENSLATWISIQQYAKSCWEQGKPCINKMTPERIAILKSMSWKIWDAQEGAWQSRFEELVKHVDKFGEHPPQSHPTLGKWVQNQRTAYQAWKARLNNGTEKCEDVSHSMDEERIRKLESVPQWSWKPVADTWEANYQVLFTYAHKHKKLPPVSHLKLWIWIDSQRLAYRAWQACLKGESDKYSNVIHYMDEERVRKLELVPYWKWSMRS